jgi:hypothetical protein
MVAGFVLLNEDGTFWSFVWSGEGISEQEPSMVMERSVRMVLVDPRIEMLSPQALKPWAKNARTHSKKQVRQIADSIRRFGFTNPVLIDGSQVILAGHGRVEAAKLIGMIDVPCLRFDHMTEAEKRAYVIADNKLALNAGWDEQLLAEELKGLLAEDAGFDVALTGFSIAEVDTLIEGLSVEDPGDLREDAMPAEAPGSCPCSPDGWRAGRHGLHRSALQRANRGSCQRTWQDEAPRVLHGVRRDERR